MASLSQTLQGRLETVEDTSEKRLNRILELEGLEKDVEIGKKRVEQYKNSSHDLEIRVMQMTSEIQVKDEEMARLISDIKAGDEKNKRLARELEDA